MACWSEKSKQSTTQHPHQRESDLNAIRTQRNKRKSGCDTHWCLPHREICNYESKKLCKAIRSRLLLPVEQLLLTCGGGQLRANTTTSCALEMSQLGLHRTKSRKSGNLS